MKANLDVRRDVLALAFHGTLIMIVGFLEGSAYGLAITSRSPAEVVTQWPGRTQLIFAPFLV